MGDLSSADILLCAWVVQNGKQRINNVNKERIIFLGYCDGLVGGLPSPIDLNRQAFAKDPLVHALFATASDIDQMLGRSQAVRDYLADPACWESEYFYALFAARRLQKKQIGMSIQGDVVQTDVPQLVLYFSDQTLIQPACSLEKTKSLLRSTALDSLLSAFHEHVDALRAEREGLRADLSVERAHLTTLRGKTAGPALSGPHPPSGNTRRPTQANCRIADA